MSDEDRHEAGLRDPARSLAGGRVSGLQAHHTAAVAVLHAAREQLPPREWHVLRELVTRWLDADYASDGTASAA
jgi:hypothetical protein